MKKKVFTLLLVLGLVAAQPLTAGATAPSGSTSVTVYMTAPDGTKSRENTLAVNTNSYLFAYYDFSQSGEYTVTWQVVGKEAVSTVFQVN